MRQLLQKLRQQLLKADTVTNDLVSKAATTELADATKYPHAGVYTFTVNEVKGDVAGMTYDTKLTQ